MGKTLLKIQEKIRKERAQKELEKQKAIVAEIDSKERARQSKIDAVESKYGSDMQLYQVACQQRGVGDPAIIRLALLCHEQDVRKYPPAEWKILVEQYGLSNFAEWLNSNNAPKKPPVKPIIDPLED